MKRGLSTFVSGPIVEVSAEQAAGLKGLRRNFAYPNILLQRRSRAQGEIFMPMSQSFFAFRFAMLRDKFGTSWMILAHSGDAPVSRSL